MYNYAYPRPSVTADVVLLARSGGELLLLLIQRAAEPFKGRWALPGGFVDQDEDLEAAARRELLEETGLEAGPLLQVGAFGKPGRDPRGHTVTVAYATVMTSLVEARAGDDARQVQWFSLNALPELAFDHDVIIAAALQRLYLGQETVAQHQ